MKALFTIGILMILISGTKVLAQDKDMHMKHGTDHIMINEDELKWVDGPEALPKGLKIAVLEGNPHEAGPFTMRLKFPENYEVQPHWHPAIEHLSVLDGSFYMGTGETFNREKATLLEEGAFAVMPAKFVHYAFTKEGATIQLHGMGPWAIYFVNAKNVSTNQPQ